MKIKLAGLFIKNTRFKFGLGAGIHWSTNEDWREEGCFIERQYDLQVAILFWVLCMTWYGKLRKGTL